MTNKGVTMQVIANQLGITKVSVSKALNDQPGVSEELKRQILETSHKLGYKKNRLKKESADVKKLGFLVPKRFFLENDNFYTVIYYYMTRECAQKNINMHLFIIDPVDEKEFALPFSFKQYNLNGVFFAGEIGASYIDLIKTLNIPIVIIDFYNSHLTEDCVITDNFYAGYVATINLIDKGHYNIGFVGNTSYTTSIMDRFYGYRKALSENGLEYIKEWHISNNDVSGVYTLEHPLPDPMPTAFVCHCDMAAYYLMLKLQSQGISVPGQVSLVSFDNTKLSQKCNPPLTTIDINKREIAHKSLQQLLWRIEHPAAEVQRVLLNTRLIERSSTQKLHSPSLDVFDIAL